MIEFITTFKQVNHRGKQQKRQHSILVKEWGFMQTADQFIMQKPLYVIETQIKHAKSNKKRLILKISF